MRNPEWTREELILALDLYFKLDIDKLRKLTGNSPQMIELSSILRSIPIHSIECRQSVSFRSASSVHMKLMNFLRCDSRYGKAGLSNGSKLEGDIWNEFSTDIQRLKSEAEEILKKYRIKQSVQGIAHVRNGNTAYYQNENVLLGSLLEKANQMLKEIEKLYGYYNENRRNAAFIEPIEESQKTINNTYQKILAVNELKEKLSEIEKNIIILQTDSFKSHMSAETLAIKTSGFKIGEFVKSALSFLFVNGKFNKNDINNMLDKEWSKRTFHLGHSLLKAIDERFPLDDQKKVDGYNRYWSEIFTYDGKRYLICKEWFETNRKYFMGWIKDYGVELNSLSNLETVKKEETNEKLVKFPIKYCGISLSEGLLKFILQTIKEIDAEDVYVETNNILKRVSGRIQNESSYKYPQHCLNNIIKILVESGVLILYQDAKRGKYVIEDYEIMQKFIDNPRTILELSNIDGGTA